MKTAVIFACFASSVVLAAPAWNSTNKSYGGALAFNGKNHGIGSWFRTNNAAEFVLFWSCKWLINSNTNGRSWCQYNYEDSWLGFAPSVGTMIDAAGGSGAAQSAFCGKMAYAYNPKTGMSATIKLVDGFDDAWVRSPGSIDLTQAAYQALTGYWPSDKNDVIYDLQWCTLLFLKKT